jgi:hypothetical protein
MRRRRTTDRHIEPILSRFMAALKAQGVSRDTLPYKAPFQPYGAWVALFFTFLITFFKVRFVLNSASLASPLSLLSPADAFVSPLGLCVHSEVEHGQLHHVGRSHVLSHAFH